jgi:hypothetical protein
MKKNEPIEADKSWQAEDDARTLLRAEEIKKDAKRLNAAKAHLKKQKDAIMSIDDLEAAANEYAKEKNKKTASQDEEE